MHQLLLCSTACLLMTLCACSIEYAPPYRCCCVCCCRHRLVRPIHGSSHLRPSLQQRLPEGFLGRASFSNFWESCIGICRLTSLMPPVLWCKQVVAVPHVLWVHAGSADSRGRHDLVDRRLHVSALSLADCIDTAPDAAALNMLDCSRAAHQSRPSLFASAASRLAQRTQPSR